MAKVHITNVVVLDNPSSFYNPFQFELTFECIEELKEDLEWKMIYVGSAESEEYDQVLDTVSYTADDKIVPFRNRLQLTFRFTLVRFPKADTFSFSKPIPQTHPAFLNRTRSVSPSFC